MPYGPVLKAPSTLLPTSVGYEGQYGYYTDAEDGLVLLGARYYDPGTTRFLNRDPIDYKGGSNLYAYCDGNPVNEIDPTGHAGDGGGIFGWILQSWFGSNRQSMSQLHQDDMAGAYAAMDGSSYDSAYTASVQASNARQDNSRAVGGNCINYLTMLDGVGEIAIGARTVWEIGLGVTARRTLAPVAVHTAVDTVAGAEERQGMAAVLRRINRGDPHPYPRDGIEFRNRPCAGKTTPELPVQPSGYYREYTVPTPGAATRGARRIVTGSRGEIYYTNSHYEQFIQLR
jgi:RHS repeat-associated protein